MESTARFRRKLAAGELCIGASISFTDALVSDALAGSVDFLWIDLEHSLMSTEALGGHLLAARSNGVPALVRVTGSDTPFIKPVLDAGANWIIVPQVRGVDEVRRVVGDCRYPPLGNRGYGPRVPSNYGRDGGKDYIERANRDVFVCVQIETLDALEAIDDILAVPGLDSLVIGPCDLSSALGVLGDVENPRSYRPLRQSFLRHVPPVCSSGRGWGRTRTMRWLWPDAAFSGCKLAGTSAI